MKKLILNWLFGTDNVKEYIELLNESCNYYEQCIDSINKHLETLEKAKKDLDIMRKLIKICKNHGINIDEEIKHIEL